jgi:protein tyrosine phosphatase (PTP) superfamily phosphohydrolase (DUF442 family)
MKRIAQRLILIAGGWCLTTGCGPAGSSVDSRLGDSRLGGEASACPRRILQSQVTNARDIGGHPLSAGKTAACRSFFRGGDLSGLDAAGCAELAALGIKTVVDLREPDVQQSQPPPACVTAQATRVLAPMPKLLPDTPENYLALFKETAAVAKVFSVLGDAGSYPVYAHCIIGRDRASFVSALMLLALGASRDTLLAEFKLSEEAGVVVKPECMQAVLDEVDKRGGIEAYLTTAGVSSAQLGVLRNRMSP